MRIGELARRSGVSERMLRYYEQQGLLRPARTEAHYRDYGEAEFLAAMRIRQLNESGLKLNAIRILLPCMVDGPATFQPCDEIRSVLTEELAQLERKLHDLKESRDIVVGYLASLERTER